MLFAISTTFINSRKVTSGLLRQPPTEAGLSYRVVNRGCDKQSIVDKKRHQISQFKLNKILIYYHLIQFIRCWFVASRQILELLLRQYVTEFLLLSTLLPEPNFARGINIHKLLLSHLDKYS